MRHILGICAVILLLSRAGAGQPLNFVVINLDDIRFDGVDLMPVLGSATRRRGGVVLGFLRYHPELRP